MGTPVRRRRVLPWRGMCFAGGLLVVLVALDSPVERLADDWFWAHMLQHVLLMMVAAPLLVLGAPWLPFWRPLPLGLRRWLARMLVKMGLSEYKDGFHVHLRQDFSGEAELPDALTICLDLK